MWPDSHPLIQRGNVINLLFISAFQYYVVLDSVGWSQKHVTKSSHSHTKKTIRSITGLMTTNHTNDFFYLFKTIVKTIIILHDGCIHANAYLT